MIRARDHHPRCPQRGLLIPTVCTCVDHGWDPVAAAAVTSAPSGYDRPGHLVRPFFYREPANGVTLAVTYQGSDGLAFVAQPPRDAMEPYEQYGVVLPPEVVRDLARRMLASVGNG